MVSTTYPTLINLIWRKQNSVFRNFCLIIFGSFAMWASAKIQIPFYPVPLSMQTFVVLIIGMSMGWKLGSATIIFYLAQGIVGLPVFAGTPEKGLGLVYILGPTGGFLIGFVLAVAVVGWLAERGFNRTIPLAASAMIIGNIVIYIPGVLWLGSVIGWDKPVIELGILPFLLGDALKILIATILLPKIWKFCRIKASSK